MHTIKFDFEVTECNGWPGIVFLIDDDTLLEHQFTQEQETVELPIDLLEGEHLLEIERTNVGKNNTEIDADGNIVKDQIVELTEMYVDNVRIPDFFKYRGVYHLNGTEYPQGLVWGGNGVWHWEFETPIITWMLEEDIINSEKHNNTEILFKDYIKEHDIQVDRLRKLIDDME